MTPDRRSYTERVRDAAGRLNTGHDWDHEAAVAVEALNAAGIRRLMDERRVLLDALDEARARVDGQAWADLEADRDRYRDALAELLAGIAASPRPDQRNWVEARVYLPDLDDAREMMRGAS